MDLPVVTYEKEEYVETASGNKICKKNTIASNTIFGTQNIIISGKTIIQKDVILRGDLAVIRIGRYCIVQRGTIIRPSLKQFVRKPTMFPVTIGDSVFVEEECVINAAYIGSFVHVGARSVLGRACTIKECCRVLPDSVVSADAVFPPFSTIGGNPARIVGQEPECTENLMVEATTMYYDNFVPSNLPKASFA
ncbi:unnamed protein product [Caenorhabditis auriculariae]|uniref:Dynactin subunit 5 n=1 Tax=Caenorhabditis auriculariae TaxID=2777116 RepID=A0A8S1GPI0_9PELO|nr:unnamed protein product [Caenorhabditis auriculariae]